MKMEASTPKSGSSTEGQHPAASAPLLTPDQLAVILTWKCLTILRWAAKGKIPSYRAGRAYRFKLADVLEALTPRAQGEFVFAKASGIPYHSVRNVFDSACQRAGLQDVPCIPSGTRSPLG